MVEFLVLWADMTFVGDAVCRIRRKSKRGKRSGFLWISHLRLATLASRPPFQHANVAWGRGGSRGNEIEAMALDDPEADLDNFFAECEEEGQGLPGERLGIFAKPLPWGRGLRAGGSRSAQAGVGDFVTAPAASPAEHS